MISSLAFFMSVLFMPVLFMQALSCRLRQYQQRLLSGLFLSGGLLFAGYAAAAGTDMLSAQSVTAQSLTEQQAQSVVGQIRNEETLNDVLAPLRRNNFQDKQSAVERLVKSHHPAEIEILQALTIGNLYFTPQDFYLADSEKQYRSVTALDVRAEPQPDAVKKVVINNPIRQWIRNNLALVELESPDSKVRSAAMQQILNSNNYDALDTVKTALSKESNDDIKRLMSVYIAKIDLQGEDSSRHHAAIEILSQSALPENLSLLQNYAEKAPTLQLQQQANQAINKINNKMILIKGAETFSFGLSLGSILVLTAIGLAITFGVMGVINMAHGELMMIGAYCAYIVQQLMPNHIGLSVFIALPTAFVVCAFVGILIERFVVRYLYGRPLETLLATFGISLILQQAVRSVFTPLNRMVQTPGWMSGTWQIIPGLAITWNRVYILLFCLICFFVLLGVMKYTRLGLEVGAVSQNREMARAMGINDRRVDMMTFALGSGVAGLAGVALSQLTNVGPNLGQQYIVDSFMVVVVGGVGNLWGTLVSGLGLGIINQALEPWMGAVLAKCLVLVFIILFIQKYPRGLFPQKGRAIE